MKYSELKALKELIDDDWREAAEQIAEHSGDFMAGDWRFIHEDDIDEIMTEELSSDTYMLGYFNASFIADITGLDYSVIERAQKNESFELLGELMLKHIDEVQSEYASLDGYGHHFASYDGHDNEFDDYHVFRC